MSDQATPEPRATTPDLDLLELRMPHPFVLIPDEDDHHIIGEGMQCGDGTVVAYSKGGIWVGSSIEDAALRADAIAIPGPPLVPPWSPTASATASNPEGGTGFEAVSSRDRTG